MAETDPVLQYLENVSPPERKPLQVTIGAQPEPAPQPEPQEPVGEQQPLPELFPVTLDKPQLDYFTGLFSSESGNPASKIASVIAGEVGVGIDPALFSYKGLRDGTAGYFDRMPETANLSSRERAMSDEQIVSAFAQDSEGRPIEGATFFEGVQRAAIPSVISFSGALAGGRAAALATPYLGHPLAKLVAVGAGGAVGALGGQFGGEYITDKLMGKERPILPGHTAAYEMGKTGMGALAWLAFPFMLPSKVNLGTAEYLANVANLASRPAVGPVRPTRAIRFADAAARMVGGSGEAARAAPIATTLAEGIIGTGQTLGAGLAEEYQPGGAWSRVGLELLGGATAASLAQPATAILGNFGKIKELFKGVSERYKSGGLEGVAAGAGFGQRARQEEAVRKIITLLEQGGEDVNAIIERLASNELAQYLVDDSGKPILQTAGMKAASPTLLAIEASLDQIGSGLGGERIAASKASTQALKNVILAMAQTGDQEAMKAAADMAAGIFEQKMIDDLARASDTVLTAFYRVRGDTPESNIALSERLYDTVAQSLDFARQKERQVWSRVPEVVIPTDPATMPNFLKYWDDLDGLPQEAKDYVTEGLAKLGQFAARKKQELGYTFDAQGNPIPPSDDLRTTELIKMRSVALQMGRELSAAGKENNARIAYEMADAMMDDLQSLTGQADLFKPGSTFALAYDLARAYTKSLNDTYTRAFGGKALATAKTGEERIAPELLAKRIFQGGNDPTYLRLKQINDIGRFALREGLESAEETTGSVKSVTQKVLRNIRASAFDLDTGQIDPAKLRKSIEENKEVLDLFPDLKADLLNAERANVLLDQTTTLNKARLQEEMAQRSFYDLINPRTVNGRLLGAESPTTVIASVVGGKAPRRGLDRLFKVVNSPDLPGDQRTAAISGMKSAILEWAATKAGITGGTFSPSALYDQIYKPMKGSEGRLSLAEWMKSRGVISEPELDNLKTLLTEMVRFEAAEASGSLGDLVDKAGPIMDFYVSIVGSAAGSRAHSLLSGGGGAGTIIASGRGADAAKRLYNQIPGLMKLDVMSELMRDPEKLAMMMRNPKTKKERERLSLRVAEALGNFITRSVKPAIPATLRETTRERYEPEAETTPAAPQTAPVGKQSSVQQPATVRPTTVAAAAPAATAARPAPIPPVPPVTAPPNPATRAQYAALFPSDLASGMIRQQGIGSLMG